MKKGTIFFYHMRREEFNFFLSRINVIFFLCECMCAKKGPSPVSSSLFHFFFLSVVSPKFFFSFFQIFHLKKSLLSRCFPPPCVKARLMHRQNTVHT